MSLDACTEIFINFNNILIIINNNNKNNSNPDTKLCMGLELDKQ